MFGRIMLSIITCITNMASGLLTVIIKFDPYCVFLNRSGCSGQKTTRNGGKGAKHRFFIVRQRAKLGEWTEIRMSRVH